jgi:hypothetical protein
LHRFQCQTPLLISTFSQPKDGGRSHRVDPISSVITFIVRHKTAHYSNDLPLNVFYKTFWFSAPTRDKNAPALLFAEKQAWDSFKNS